MLADLRAVTGPFPQPAAGRTGHAESRFIDIVNTRWQKRDQLAERVLLAWFCAGAMRCWDLLDGLGRAWLLLYLAALGAHSLWRSCRPAAHLRWRRLTAALLRAAGMGLGLGGAVMQQLLAQQAAAAGTASSFALTGIRLLFSSGLPTLLLFSQAWMTSLSLSAVAQVLLVGSTLPHSAGICAALDAGHPAVQGTSHSIYQLLSGLAFLVPQPLVPFTLQPDGAAQCSAVLAWLQVSGGLLAPLLWQAVSEARLFNLHQRARRDAGLQAEQGFDASVYAVVWDAIDEGSYSRIAFLAWLLLSVVWNACSLWYALEAPTVPA